MGVGGASAATEKIAATMDKMPGGNHMVDSIEFVVNWARANSLWPLVYGTACCAMEMMSAGSSRHDWARFGVEVARATPRQADLIVLAGTIVEKMGDNLVTLYEQMPGPKYVIAMGSCAISGGPFYYDSYSVIRGGDRLIPVDVYIPGCPPRPEALLYGIMELQKKIRKEGRRNPWKIASLMKEPFTDTYSETLTFWKGLEEKKDLQYKKVRQDFKKSNPDFKQTKPKRVKKPTFNAVAANSHRTHSGLANDEILAIIKDNYPYIEVSMHSQMIELTIDKDSYKSFIAFLKNQPHLRMDMLLQLTAVDWDEHMDILVQLLSTKGGHSLFIKCSIDRLNAEIESISSIYDAADWHEREVYDLFGVNFTGHPDLRRIFLNDRFQGHPLRKDFEDATRMVRRPY